jgi:hypothetical protein
MLLVHLHLQNFHFCWIPTAFPSDIRLVYGVYRDKYEIWFETYHASHVADSFSRSFLLVDMILAND